MPSNKKLLQAAAGNAGGEGLYPEDVFSTYLYTPTGNAGLAINNGLDLSGEGGLVWSKCRGVGRSHNLIDTNRGGTKVIKSNSDSQETTNANAITAFNSNGYTLGADTSGDLNYASNTPMCSWSFRKAEGFCDIVTYTGNGTAGRTVAHSLGSAPKLVLVKRTNTSNNWICWHTSLANNKYIQLNASSPAYDDGGIFWNNTTPDASNLTLGNDSGVNGSGSTYVAYLFGDDAIFGEDGDEQICKMGSYTGNGNNTGPIINCGFEPQWILIKKTSSTGGNKSWIIVDAMRGIVTGGDDAFLTPNESSAEFNFDAFSLTATGFQVITSNDYVNTNGVSYIYMAIRRPMKVPEAGTEVFIANEGTASAGQFVTGFPVDLSINGQTSGSSKYAISRLGGEAEALITDQNSNYVANGPKWFTNGNANTVLDLYTNWWSGSTNVLSWSFKRASKFMDVVIYTATPSSSGQTDVVTHNLNVVPELIICKNRTGSNIWMVYHKDVGLNKYLQIATTDAQTSGTWSFPALPTATQFTTGFAYPTGVSVISFLFATLDGISKVGSYTGTGGTHTVNCGFSNGARFILIKRADGSGDWYVWDSVRGITTGNDPYLLLNSTAAEVTNTDYIYPHNSGFQMRSNAPAALNASGGTYIFLAIA